MKTNYESKRSEESRKIIQIIGSYAEKNSKRTKEKRTTYTSILERCI